MDVHLLVHLEQKMFAVYMQKQQHKLKLIY